jgi:hypothetical protein
MKAWLDALSVEQLEALRDMTSKIGEINGSGENTASKRAELFSSRSIEEKFLLLVTLDISRAEQKAEEDSWAQNGDEDEDRADGKPDEPRAAE